MPTQIGYRQPKEPVWKNARDRFLAVTFWYLFARADYLDKEVDASYASHIKLTVTHAAIFTVLLPTLLWVFGIMPLLWTLTLVVVVHYLRGVWYMHFQRPRPWHKHDYNDYEGG